MADDEVRRDGARIHGVDSVRRSGIADESETIAYRTRRSGGNARYCRNAASLSGGHVGSPQRIHCHYSANALYYSANARGRTEVVRAREPLS